MIAAHQTAVSPFEVKSPLLVRVAVVDKVGTPGPVVTTGIVCMSSSWKSQHPVVASVLVTFVVTSCLWMQAWQPRLDLRSDAARTYEQSMHQVWSQFDQCRFTDNGVIKEAIERMSSSDTKLQLSDQHAHLHRVDDASEIGSLPAASLHNLSAKEAWPHCLPMSWRVCNIGTMEMLIRNTPLPPDSTSSNANFSSLPAGSSRKEPLCKSSVLHLLLEETWSVMREIGCDALPMFGSLLGAVRDHSIIQYTHDVDIAYFPRCSIHKLTTALWEKGYLIIDRGMHSWCIAAHHPLAPYMYDPNAVIVRLPQVVPYGDLYHVLSTDEPDPKGFEIVNYEKPHLKPDDIFPLQCERIYNNEYPVMRRAQWWLQKMYGDGWVKQFDQLDMEKKGRTKAHDP